MKELKRILPDYPSTLHINWKPNTSRNDMVASNLDCNILFNSIVSVEEKIDGSNCGMALYDGHPVIRNSDHILAKGYVKNTPAKKQFASVFNWFYQYQKCFEKINALAGPVGVFGEWMVMAHGMKYDKLPSYFIAFDLYDYEARNYVATPIARKLLKEAGFILAPQLHFGTISSYEQLELFANRPSPFSTTAKAEGIYVKISNDYWVTHRFKMVRADFKQGSLFGKTMVKNNLVNK